MSERQRRWYAPQMRTSSGQNRSRRASLWWAAGGCVFLAIAVALLVAEDDGGFSLVARWMAVIGLGGVTYQHLAHAYFNATPEADTSDGVA